MSSDPDHVQRKLEEWGRIFDVQYIHEPEIEPIRTRFEGCIAETIEVVLRQTFPRESSRWLRLRDRMATRLIRWAAWLGRYEMHYNIDMKYKEMSEEA